MSFNKENPEILDRLRSIGQDHIAISIVTVGELLYGVLNKKELRQISKDLSHLHEIHISRSTSDVFTRLMTEYT